MFYYYPLSGLLNGILAVILGLFVYTRNPADRRYVTYGLFCLSLAIWSFCYFFWLTASTESSALFWARTLIMGAAFIPVTSYHHVVQLIGVSSPFRQWVIRGGYVVSFLLLLMSFTPFVVASVSPNLSFRYWPNPGPAFHVHVVMFALFVCGSVYELYRAFKTASGRWRNHLWMLLVTITIAYLGGGTNYFLWYDIPILPVGNVLIAIYIAVFAYALIAYRLMDVTVFIKKSLIYALQLLMLLIPCYLLLMGTQIIFFGYVSPTFSVVALILFIFVGFFFPKLRFRTEEAFERVLFKKRHDYRATLLRSSREMVSMVDLEAVSDALIQTVVKALEIEKASLFLLDESSGTFKLRSSVGLGADPSRVPDISRDEPLVQAVMKRPEALIREELEMADGGVRVGQLARKMRQLQAEITLPLNSKDRLIGILNLGHRERKEMYSQEDIEVLSTLANQAAIAIENARLYENLKQSQNIIRRADRLSSLGMLTAGLAHEIRNPLVAIRTFTQLLPERYQDQEFRDGFQSLALKEVDRICGLVNDLLSFARPSTPNMSPQDVNEIVANIARILESQAKEKDVKIGLQLTARLPKIFIDKEQIKQVCMNLILNAIQSIEGGGTVKIGTHLFGENGSRRFVQIQVQDTGIGIPEKDIENIFNPFFTTKKDGSGLGLSISHQIIKEHAGYMVVESQVGRGTSFFIRLPVSYLPQRATTSSPQINEDDPGHR
ncbi:MAG TPA: ATP-binding protein [Candidatus Binatia bacterium]|jgi:two-component system nitrogen regulation sensor histidine kinase GlnL